MVQAPGDETTVKCQKYEYVKMGQTDKGKDIKRITLVNKETHPNELLIYFESILVKYPHHQYMASWQQEQMETLRDSLPQGHVLMIHDCSENYQCSNLEKLQSEYFSRPEVSLHITVLYRHAIEPGWRGQHSWSFTDHQRTYHYSVGW